MNTSYSASQSSLQQQPQRSMDRQQQQSSGSGEMQGAPEIVQQMGEDSYEGNRDYVGNVKPYLKKEDVKSDALVAKPQNLQEAIDLERAERQGLLHAKAPGQ